MRKKFKKEVYKMKKYLTLLLIIAFATFMLFMGISCKDEGEVRLTNNPANDGLPSWSPDGKMIAFDSDRDGNWEIYVMGTDGSGETNLTNNPADEAASSWSPDGKMIAFQSNRDGNSEIYIMNADGQE